MDLKLHAFCHLRPERSFNYGDISSLLCIRCSAIYSAFLLCFILALLIRWNGEWSWGSKKIQPIFALVLILFSPIQVGLEDTFGHFLLTGEFARFLVGCAAGLGLLQLLLILNNDKKENSSFHPSFLFIFLGLFTGHYLMCEISWRHSAITSLIGLSLLYLTMNRLVLRSFAPKLNNTLTYTIVAIMVASEWIGLYFYNGGA